MSQVPPTRRVVAQPLLDPASCAAIIASVADAHWQPGIVGRPSYGGEERAAPLRSCTLVPLTDPALLQRISEVALWVNAQLFGFKIDGLRTHDLAAIVRYQVGDRFDWHPDIGPAGTPAGSRKLSFTLQLSSPESYEGGDLEMGVHHLAEPAGDDLRRLLRGLGTLVLFPSFLVHRVTPVRAGVRHAIVGWLHGPPFT